MNLENEKRFRNQNIIITLCAIAYIVVMLAALHGMKELKAEKEHWQGEANSMLSQYENLDAKFTAFQEDVKETNYQYDKKIKSLNADKDKLESANKKKDKEIESLKKTLRTLN